MKKLQITNTTDGKFIGFIIDESNPIEFTDQFIIYYDKIVELSDGLRFINSNYVIDTKEIIDNGEDNW